MSKNPPAGLLIDIDTPLNPPSKLSSPQIQNDISLFLHAFQNGYGAYKFIDAALIQQAEANISALSGHASLSPEILGRKLGAILNQLPDAHLLTQTERGYCLSPKERDQRVPSVGRNVHITNPSAHKSWTLTYRQIKSKNIPILGIVRFPPPEDEDWKEFGKAIQSIKKAEAIIIDLRGNQGGHDGKGFDLAASLNGAPVSVETSKHITKQTPAAWALLANGDTLRIRRFKNQGANPPDYLVQRQADFAAKYQQAQQENYPHEEITDTSRLLKGESSGGPKYEGPIYILADAGCGSSGETVLEGLRTLDKSTFIGENTAGVVHVRNNGMLILPHSKIRVQMGTKFVTYKDNRFVEKRGYTPDITVWANHDALQTAWSLISESDFRP